MERSDNAGKSRSFATPETQKKIGTGMPAGDRLFDALAGQSSDIIVLVNREGVVIYENNAVEGILGFNVAERIGSEAFVHVHPDELTAVTAKFHALFADQNTPMDRDEIRICDIDGNWHHFEVVASRLTQDKTVAAIVINLREITQRRKAEEELRRSEEKYRSILENISEAYFELNLAGNIIFANDAGCAMLGYDRDTIFHLNYRQYSTPETKRRLQETFGEVFRTGMPVRMEDYEIIRRDGSLRIHQLSVGLIRDEEGKPAGFRTVARDVTEERMAEQALRQSEARYRQREERYRSILDNMEEAYYEVDLKGNMTFCNTAAVKNLGYTDSEMIGMNFHQYVDEENAGTVREAFHHVYLTGETTKGVDWEAISKTGGKIPVESSISLMRDEQGNPIGFRGVIRDITERKQAEAALRESEEKFRNLTETAQDAIVTTDLNGIITYANPAARALASGAVVVGAALADFLPPDPTEKQMQALVTAGRNYSTPMSYESKIVTTSDGPLYFDVRSSTLLTGGRPAGVLFVARDATERKRTEEEVRRMAVIDTLTGLYNRRGFIALAEQQMKISVRSEKKLLLFFIDLDGLKFVNDTWGHEEGDRAIRRTAVILKKTFRETDIVSRLGGDEFAAMVVDSPDLPEVILKRLQGRTDEENTVSDIPYQITMSIGVADYDPASPCSIHELMSHADQLMYRQKKTKKQMAQYPYQ